MVTYLIKSVNRNSTSNDIFFCQMTGKLREEDEGQWKSNQNGERSLCVAESGQKPRSYGCILFENSTVLGKQWYFNWFSGCVHVDSY